MKIYPKLYIIHLILYLKVTLPPIKEQVSRRDDEVLSGNEVQVVESGYNGKQTISIGATNSFTYTVKDLPEKSILYFYFINLNYTTDSATAYGSISQFKIFDGGENYYSFQEFLLLLLILVKMLLLMLKVKI